MRISLAVSVLMRVGTGSKLFNLGGRRENGCLRPKCRRYAYLPELPITDLEQERVKLRLQIALEARRFEIDLSWKRSLFFWGFNGTALLAFGSATSAGRELRW